MKILLPILVLCFLPLIFGAHLKKNSNKFTCCVTVYADCNYKGASQQLCGNQPNLINIGWNDKISSWKSNCNPVMYSDVYGGGNKIAGQSNSDLTKSCMTWGRGGFLGLATVCKATWNDQISSIYF